MSTRLGLINVADVVSRVMAAAAEGNSDYMNVYFYDNTGREALGFQGVFDQGAPSAAPSCLYTIADEPASREAVDAFIENNYNLEVEEVSAFVADRHAEELGVYDTFSMSEDAFFEDQGNGPFEPFYDVEPVEPEAAGVAEDAGKQGVETPAVTVAVAEDAVAPENGQAHEEVTAAPQAPAVVEEAEREPEREEKAGDLDDSTPDPTVAGEDEPGSSVEAPSALAEASVGDATDAAKVSANEDKPNVAKKIVLSGGTIDDYKALLGSLKEAGLFDEASGLETIHITIENIAADAAAEKQAATTVLKNLTKEVIEKADGKLDDASRALVDAAEQTLDAVAKNTNDLVDKAGSIKQNFYDACKSGVAHVKQYGCKALCSVLKFMDVRNDIEYVKQNWADSRSAYLKSITACQEFAERKAEAKGLFKNALRVAMGRSAESMEAGKPGFFVQKHIDHLQRRVEKCEEKVDKCQKHIDHLDKFFVNTRNHDLVLAYGVSSISEKIGAEDKVVFHAPDVQSAFNAIESDPKAIYDTHKEVIDPDGKQLEHCLSQLKHGQFGEHSAYSMVVYNNSCWVNPETGGIEDLPQITDEQVRTAVAAAQNYGADTLIAEQDARNEKLWEQYQERLASEKDALDVAADTSRDVNAKAQPTQQHEVKRDAAHLG